MNETILQRLPESLAALPPRDQAVEILARTVWGEARGEPVAGKEAVAAVVLNRVALAEKPQFRWWGKTVVGVCLAPFQFSCWNADDPNFPKLFNVRGADPVYATCLRTARRAVSNVLKDPTGGATHYHRRGIYPKWAQNAVPLCEIGNHVFYRIEG